uniref:Uncharacterized protein n=1 Tax=Rhizophora mucronata TaxID=61149 RepID=A0A2P2N1J3_RHIMU
MGGRTCSGGGDGGGGGEAWWGLLVAGQHQELSGETTVGVPTFRVWVLVK